MIYSMTGFGRASATTGSRKFTAEVKSLNSKQLDLSMRVPGYMRELETTLRNDTAEALQRGKIDIAISAESLTGETSSTVNTEALRSYHAQIINAAHMMGAEMPKDIWSVLMRLPDALHIETHEATEEEMTAARRACADAIKTLNEFRAQEGNRLESFFVEKIANIRSLLGNIDEFENGRVPKIRKRLEEQLEKLEGIDYDRGRLEQELIFYIEKLDVTEEKTRLASHLDYFLQTLAGKPGQGKKLGFIAQEMGREINTLGSKSNNADMQRIVVGMKDELEQIKEQVLNVL